jgi:hypothetical protein
MKLKQIAGKGLLTMSSDNNYIYGIHEIKLENGDFISFRYNNIVPLQIAEKNLDPEIFLAIISSCEGLVKNDLIPELTNYKNQERLPVYLKETHNYFAVISFGEYQPTLYRIYLEGVFRKALSS